jgi:hypothetical protein
MKITDESNRHQIGTWAGMIGPILFISVFTIEGLARSGYDPMKMPVSELSLGHRGWIQIVNFILFGLLFLLFARGAATEFKEDKSARIGIYLFHLIGFAILASGPFVMDPSNTPRHQWTLHGTIHQILGAIAFILMPVSCFLFWRHFRKSDKWKLLQGWTLVVGIITIGMIILMKVGQIGSTSKYSVSLFPGLFQRVLLCTYLGWIFMVAFRMNGIASNKNRIRKQNEK